MNNDLYLGLVLGQWIILLLCLRGWPDAPEGSKNWALKQAVALLGISIGLTGILMGKFIGH